MIKSLTAMAPVVAAMVIMIIAPVIALWSFHALLLLAGHLGYAAGQPAIQILAAIGAIWEAVFVVLIARDLITDKA